MTKVKICGLSRQADIEAANRLRPDFVGFVFAKSRRQVTDGQAAALSAALLPEITPVGVFVNGDPDRILRLAGSGIIRAVQLHGQESIAYAEDLKRRLPPGTGLIRALSMDDFGRPDGRQCLDAWLASSVDCLLLDAGRGGTGRTFDHGLLRELLPLAKPWFLAGGMTPENAREAAEKWRPFAVDASSGVETDGVKDPEKMARLIRSLRDE